jgi:hypothetical protein
MARETAGDVPIVQELKKRAVRRAWIRAVQP